MQQLLIVSATHEEVRPFLQHFIPQFSANDVVYHFSHQQCTCTVLITGVGMVNTAYAVARHQQQHFDAVINVGIAGAFSEHIALGECVLVIKDELAEMGAENGDEFIPYADLQLGGSNVYQAKYADNFALFNALKKVNGITVNKVHGNTESIKNICKQFNADTESMEGAAFYRSAEHMAPVVIQLRAISNRVEKRNKAAWQIPQAITQLNNLLIQLIKKLP